MAFGRAAYNAVNRMSSRNNSIEKPNMAHAGALHVDYLYTAWTCS